MVRVLIPSGALGLNYDQDALQRGVKAKPDIIAVDGGSTDSGPSYLGRGVSKYARSSTKIEWAGLMRARAEVNVPLLIGTAGTCGTDSTVDWMMDITKEIAAELGQKLKVAVVRSSQNLGQIVRAFEAGEISPLPNAPQIDKTDIENCTNIVALAGAEQIQEAIKTGADIIIAGRTTDTATISAYPLMKGCHPGAVWHGAKIGECGAFCTNNPQSGVIMIDFDQEGFTITPLADNTDATPYTVSAHMLYENCDPYILHEPGGHLDVTDAKYQSINKKSVRVTGSKWISSDTYTVKLEGARTAGYQSVLLALLRDPYYVKNAQVWADDIIEKCSQKVIDRLGLERAEFQIEIRLIGQSASFGALESKTNTPTEIGALGIVTAPKEELAAEISKLLNPYMLHHPLTDDEPTPTFAFLFSPPDIARGQTYEFVLNHVMKLQNPMDAFKLEVHEIG